MPLVTNIKATNYQYGISLTRLPVTEEVDSESMNFCDKLQLISLESFSGIFLTRIEGLKTSLATNKSQVPRDAPAHEQQQSSCNYFVIWAKLNLTHSPKPAKNENPGVLEIYKKWDKLDKKLSFTRRDTSDHTIVTFDFGKTLLISAMIVN